MIYIGNLHKGQEATLRHGVVVRCDRGHSVLCNPFRVTSEDKRNESCDRFQAYFDRKVQVKTDASFMNSLRQIYQLALQQDVTLACWCYPKRCHTQTIKAFLEQYLRKDPRYTQSQNMQSKNRQSKNTGSGLTQIEQQRLQWLEKKGCDARKRKLCAFRFIQDWLYIIRTGEMTSRQFIEEQYRYCVTNYSRRFADSFAYKAVCVLDQVKSIEKRYYRYFESDGTIALSGIHNPNDAGMRYHPYLTIHWKDDEQKPVRPKTDVRELQRQADELLPDELKSTNMHLYREGREDHSWLEGIQEERAQKEQKAHNEQLLQHLKDKYAK